MAWVIVCMPVEYACIGSSKPPLKSNWIVRHSILSLLLRSGPDYELCRALSRMAK